MSAILGFFERLWHIHGGILTAAFIVFCFAVIGWASDEWEKHKNKH